MHLLFSDINAIHISHSSIQLLYFARNERVCVRVRDRMQSPMTLDRTQVSWQLSVGLHKAELAKHRKLKEFEYLETMEAVCQGDSLSDIDNVPTHAST
eukprot:SAG31_NODE_301_length_18103_cov_13.772551_2_plen_98_part_00